MRVLFFGTYDKDAHPRVEVLIEGFRMLGDDVAECNVPLGFKTASRVEILRRPWLAMALLQRIARAWLDLWRQARRLEEPDVVIVGYLGQFDVHLARRIWRHTPVVLDLMTTMSDTARDRRSQSKMLASLLSALDSRAIRASDLVLVDTEENLRLALSGREQLGMVVPVGAPGRWFRAPATGNGPLRAVFFGLYTPLQGVPDIGRAIRMLDGEDIEFTMIGHGQDLEVTRQIVGDSHTVRWVDWISPGELPDVVADHHVCLGIFGTTSKALRVVPNKVYQGAAAGCVIVTSDTPAQRRALGEAAVYVPPGRPEELAESLRLLANDGQSVRRLRNAAHIRALRAFKPEALTAPLRDRLLSLEKRRESISPRKRRALP